MASREPLVEFKNVSVGYRKREPVLASLSFVINPGEFLGIIGPNGSGKSTVLKTLLGLLKPLSGAVQTHSDGLRTGYVQQRQFVDDIFPLRVKEIVMMGRYGLIGPIRQPRPLDWEKVEKALAIVGITDLAERPYRDLSGGQKQRTLIARALASEPSILILDEPTNDLDIRGEQQVMELLKNLHEKEKKTILVVSHMLNVVLNYAERIAFTAGEKFHFAKVEDSITEKHLSQLYQIPMKIDRVNGRKVVVPYGSAD